MEILDNDKIADVLSAFHDGCFSCVDVLKDCLIVQVDCQYLAQMINSEFNSFYIDLIEVADLSFKDWNQNISRDVQFIFSSEKGICKAESNDGIIKIFVEENVFDESPGGEIYFKVNSLKIYDEKKVPLSYLQLQEANNRYWDNFSKG